MNDINETWRGGVKKCGRAESESAGIISQPSRISLDKSSKREGNMADAREFEGMSSLNSLAAAQITNHKFQIQLSPKRNIKFENLTDAQLDEIIEILQHNAPKSTLQNLFGSL